MLFDLHDDTELDDIVNNNELSTILNEEERKEIAIAGYRRVRQLFAYENRVNEIIRHSNEGKNESFAL